jgi:hypothetical protein
VKLISRDQDRTVWLLRGVDRDSLLLLLDAGLTRPTRRPGISRHSADLNDRFQADLGDRLKAHRAAMHGSVTGWLRDPAKCAEGKGGHAWTLSVGEVETLLQALNQLRIAAWERLGRPDPLHPTAPLVPGSLEFLDWWILELASRFEGRVLHGLENG